MRFALYGEGGLGRGIGYADLLAHATEHHDLMARAEDSGCEGTYIEVARYNEKSNRWERWAFEKVFGGEHPSENDDAHVSSEATADKFAAEINKAAHGWHHSLIHHLPNYGQTTPTDAAVAACKAIRASMHVGQDGYWRAGPWASPQTKEGKGGVVELLQAAGDGR